MHLHTHQNRMVHTDRFAMVPRPDVPRSRFDVQHSHKTTFNSQFLTPIYVGEVLPGDSIRLSMTAFARLATPIVPVMDNLAFESHFFFVPNRLLWDKWKRFMGEQNAPTDTTEFLTPYVTIAAASLSPQVGGVAGLADYMGISNNGSGNALNVLAFPFRAYHLIWNEWFRDQDIQTPVSVPTGDGPDTYAGLYGLLPRGKRHDYFTSARPWPAKPVNNTKFPDTGAPMLPGEGFYMATNINKTYGAGAPVTGLLMGAGGANASTPSLRETGSRVRTAQVYSTATSQLYTEVGAGDFPSIRVLVQDMRTAELVQHLMERNARGGSRYTELVRAHFGVVSPDARLQRPEYLGGGRTMVSVNPVAQTSASGVAGTSTVLGELAGVASALAHNHGFNASFTEHGIILGLASIRSDLTYQQGVERFWFRRSVYDYYWPDLAHLGEQAILSQEIYADGSANDTSVFGYAERWSEYKYKPSRTSGYFRSTVATPLDMWHFGQKFTSRPVLNSLFVVDQPPMSRVLQVNTQFGEEILLDAFFTEQMTRAMPMFSIPGMGDRF